MTRLYFTSFVFFLFSLVFLPSVSFAADPRFTVEDFLKWSDTQGGTIGIVGATGNFGSSIAVIGDVDGNGYHDIVVGEISDADGGAGRGAVHILFMGANAEIIAMQKISSTTGGLTGPLDNNDFFGNAVAAIGDLDEDGIPDLAVGAVDDDDGGTSRGAVYILFLNANGTVKAEQKISDTVGGFDGVLANNANFGSGITAIGDLDGDGVMDLAVGSQGFADGGANSGAVWILFMNDDGTVEDEQQISVSVGGLVGLGAGTRFGSGIATIGDLDGDDVPDLLVGAVLDATVAANAGAMWILFMNDDGTVKDQVKYTGFAGLGANSLLGMGFARFGDMRGDGTFEMAAGARGLNSVYLFSLNAEGEVLYTRRVTEGTFGFEGELNGPVGFGNGLAVHPDMNGDGVPDLLVGSPFDNDGGANRGAAWALFMQTNYVYVPTERRASGSYPSGAQMSAALLGSVCTDSLKARLSLTASNATLAYVADNAEFHGAVWRVMSEGSTTVVDLPISGSGTKTFYAFFESGSGNRSGVITSTLTVDRSSCVEIVPEEGAPASDVLALPDTGVSPVTGQVEAISEVRLGDLIRGASYDAVYLIDVDGSRRPFMNSQAYFTHYSDFAAVKQVTNATLSALPLGAPVLPKAGVVLIKLQSDPKVYAVEVHPTDRTRAVKRHVPNEQTARALYGEHWADFVIDVDVTLYARFTEGEVMATDATVDRSAMKRRVDLR